MYTQPPSLVSLKSYPNKKKKEKRVDIIIYATNDEKDRIKNRSLTFVCHVMLFSFRTRASSLCFCSIAHFAAVALSMSLIRRPTVTSRQTLRDSHSSCSHTVLTNFLSVLSSLTSSKISLFCT